MVQLGSMRLKGIFFGELQWNDWRSDIEYVILPFSGFVHVTGERMKLTSSETLSCDTSTTGWQ